MTLLLPSYQYAGCKNTLCYQGYCINNNSHVQEWWTYVCMGPADLHPNLHLGMRGTQHRAVMWRVWKEGGTGFLYWGVNCYEKANCPAAEVIILLLFACVES